MSPIPPSATPLPRVVTYYQTLHRPDGSHISVLPLITQSDISLTHLILAAIHINEDPQAITLNDQPPEHPRHQVVWAEMRVLQASGIKVMGMLGGAAKGTYTRLDGGEEQFERYYCPVRDMIRARGLDGLDLDVEEEMSLAGIVRLVDRLRADFGKTFIITLAPVAAALIDFKANLSGFEYEALEVMRGSDISWYNTQFYCGWGDMSNPLMYDYIVRKGWPPEKLVVGLVTNPANGSGFVQWEHLSPVLSVLAGRYDRFGGVMGWEYFNSFPGDKDSPWEWAKQMTGLLRKHALTETSSSTSAVQLAELTPVADPDIETNPPAELPRAFNYYSDGD